MTLTMLWGHRIAGNTSIALPNKPPSPTSPAWISEKQNVKLWNQKFGKILDELTTCVGPRVGRLLDDGLGVPRRCQNNRSVIFSGKFVGPMSVGWVLPASFTLSLSHCNNNDAWRRELWTKKVLTYKWVPAFQVFWCLLVLWLKIFCFERTLSSNRSSFVDCISRYD